MENLEIKETRESLGLSLEQFGRLIGCSFQSVANWEKGKSKPLPCFKKEIKRVIKNYRKS